MVIYGMETRDTLQLVAGRLIMSYIAGTHWQGQGKITCSTYVTVHRFEQVSTKH
jgi:hypothetical protein